MKAWELKEMNFKKIASLPHTHSHTLTHIHTHTHTHLTLLPLAPAKAAGLVYNRHIVYLYCSLFMCVCVSVCVCVCECVCVFAREKEKKRSSNFPGVCTRTPTLDRYNTTWPSFRAEKHWRVGILKNIIDMIFSRIKILSEMFCY